jgi:hypothetical protein
VKKLLILFLTTLTVVACEAHKETTDPTPSGWQALTYDQQHTVCSEAAVIFEEKANAYAEPGHGWPTAKASFYSRCMECRGTIKVLAYITEENRLGFNCTERSAATGTLQYTVPNEAPAGAEQIWP